MWLILRNSNFRVILLVLLLSEVDVVGYSGMGSWIAPIHTDTRFWAVTVAGATGISLVLSSLIAGILVDRMDKRRLLVISQIAQLILSVIIAYLIVTDQFAWWQVTAIGFIRSLVWAIKITAIRTLILDVVGKANLLAANAATDVVFSVVRGILLLIVAFSVGLMGVGWVLAVTACAGLAAILLLRSMQAAEFQNRTDSASPIQDLGAGLRYFVTNPIVRTLIILGLVGEVFVWSHKALLPEMTRDVLGLGPDYLGWLGLAGGLGVLGSLLILSIRRDIKGKARLMMLAYIGMAVSLIIFAWSPWFVLSMGLLAIVHFMRTSSYAIMDTLLQTSVPNEMRGRVLSLQSLSFGLFKMPASHIWSITSPLGGSIVIPLGTQIAWAIATQLGVPAAIAIGACVVAVTGLVMLIGVSARFAEQRVAETKE